MISALSPSTWSLPTEPPDDLLYDLYDETQYEDDLFDEPEPDDEPTPDEVAEWLAEHVFTFNADGECPERPYEEEE